MVSAISKGGLCLAIMALAAIGVPAAILAADSFAGKKRANQCIVCHGQNGVAVNPEAPNLAGESAVYIEKQLRAFRSGARQHEVMSIIAKSLSDEDIGNLAAWYSAMKVSVELPKVN